MKGALKGVTSAVSNVNDVVVGLKKAVARPECCSATTRWRAISAGRSRPQGRASVTSLQICRTARHSRHAAAGRSRGRPDPRGCRECAAATADLGQATRKADALMTDLSSRQIPQKAGELVDRLRDSAQHIHQITSDISKPDQAGMSAGANIRASLTNVNAATANLADVTEAAKHNFAARLLQQEGLLQPGGHLPGKVSPGWGLHQSLEPANLAVRLGAVPERVERGGAVRQGKGA